MTHGCREFKCEKFQRGKKENYKAYKITCKKCQLEQKMPTKI